MAQLANINITNKGYALLTKVNGGLTKLQFTKFVFSSTVYSDGALQGLTDISPKNQTGTIDRISIISSTQAKVGTTITNATATTGYYINTIGLYAQDPNDGEILFSVAKATSPDYMPDINSPAPSTMSYDFITAVSNTANITLNVAPNGLVTRAEFDNLANAVGYSEKGVIGVEWDLTKKVVTRIGESVGLNAGTDFNKYTMYGGRKRCNVTDDGVVVAYYGDNEYTESGKLTKNAIVNGVTYPIGTAVQVMVEQPRFYYKVIPLQLDKIEYKEVNTVEITANATTSGNVTVNLDGKNYNIAVLSGDTKEAVANKIRATAFTGWTVSGTGANVIFTSNSSGEKVTTKFNGGITEVTATVTKTTAGNVAKGFHMRKARYYVSDVAKSGFKLHPAFIRNGKEKNFIYLSAYEGTLYDDSVGAYIYDDAQVMDTLKDKLSSIANAKPASGLTQNLTRANVRKLANNRGIGWQQSYLAAVSATQLLFLIEYASANTQLKLGNGVAKADDGSTNQSELTGATTALGNTSGSVANGSISYRGEENFWMNIWKFVDGINIEAKNTHNVYVADNGFVDDIVTTPYRDSGITISRGNGYVSAFGYNDVFDWMFLPSETTGDSVLPVGDYYYQNHTYNDWMVAILGGAWYNFSRGGGFYWIVDSAASTRSRIIGGRLVYVPNVV